MATEMLDTAFDLIGEATSNSLLMFCFCNLIIFMILTGSSKPGSMYSQDSTFSTLASFNSCSIASDYDDDEKSTVAAIPSAQKESFINDSNDSDEDEYRGSSHGSDEDDDEKMIVAAVASAQDESLINDSNDSDEDEEDRGSSHCSDDDEDNEDKIIEAEVEEEEEDDELRKRAEEFIAKINNEWRHEKLKALNLVY